ncbi:MAG: glycerate kinase [Chloroflexi bacterium]|nr:glycerate kinase [Chloroflexota bacterium]MBM3173553.1 glycerate kinase [Chloroflexota bacterium]MBM3174622.1 glycerate kinase [Chloroflexota bacterium]MBM4449376.1 glycerate kinase [Chloroflexota bacterium]
MSESLREDALKIINQAIRAVYPEDAVKKALSAIFATDTGKSGSQGFVEGSSQGFVSGKKIFVLAIGKAAWRMAKAANEGLKGQICGGLVITKYGYSMGVIDGFEVWEAGHPIPDENSIKATERALEMVEDLREKDNYLLLLVSGGGSSLFELPTVGVSLSDIVDVTNQLLKSGASIQEINAVRKHMSKVKGGRFAQIATPLRVFSLVLSDVLGDKLDTIASGPAYPDCTTSEDAIRVMKKYSISSPPGVLDALKLETPKSLDNVETRIIGSLSVACASAKQAAEELGYNASILTTVLDCQAREAGAFLSAVACEVVLRNQPIRKPCVIIAGGETVVEVRGDGLGGRNQELALSAARGIAGLKNVVIASVATDGTDGPTDAAGGMIDGSTTARLEEHGIAAEEVLLNNDSYHALKAVGDLIVTGPTGTNVNDLMLVLCK